MEHRSEDCGETISNALSKSSCCYIPCRNGPPGHLRTPVLFRTLLTVRISMRLVLKPLHYSGASPVIFLRYLRISGPHHNTSLDHHNAHHYDQVVLDPCSVSIGLLTYIGFGIVVVSPVRISRYPSLSLVFPRFPALPLFPLFLLPSCFNPTPCSNNILIRLYLIDLRLHLRSPDLR